MPREQAPIPTDILSMLGDVSAEIQEAKRELKDLDRQIEDTVRRGESLDPEQVRRAGELRDRIEEDAARRREQRTSREFSRLARATLLNVERIQRIWKTGQITQLDIWAGGRGLQTLGARVPGALGAGMIAAGARLTGPVGFAAGLGLEIAQRVVQSDIARLGETERAIRRQTAVARKLPAGPEYAAMRREIFFQADVAGHEAMRRRAEERRFWEAPEFEKTFQRGRAAYLQSLELPTELGPRWLREYRRRAGGAALDPVAAREAGQTERALQARERYNAEMLARRGPAAAARLTAASMTAATERDGTEYRQARHLEDLLFARDTSVGE